MLCLEQLIPIDNLLKILEYGHILIISLRIEHHEAVTEQALLLQLLDDRLSLLVAQPRSVLLMTCHDAPLRHVHTVRTQHGLLLGGIDLADLVKVKQHLVIVHESLLLLFA